MCGIVGIWNKRTAIDRHTLKAMRATLSHRGPDDNGLFIDTHANVGLGHQRLSVIDLSPSGHQPMERDDVVITYNGEIYNYATVRDELRSLGYTFTSNSDTEVLIRAYQAWGIDALSKLRGMFAFVLWNSRTQQLFLCRDRVGVKPLYYYQDSEHFICASEVRAIIAHPAVRKEINNIALGLFLQFGYIPAPFTIYKNIYAVQPGHVLTVGLGGQIEEQQYWNPIPFFKEQRIDLTEGEVLQQLTSTLTDSFSLRTVSDVPTGVFLSGGIDSSLVTALLQKQHTQQLKTYTIGFEDQRYDESVHARRVAAHCGTDHHELICTAKDAEDIVAMFPSIYDQPFADKSAIPTYLVSRFARNDITAALSADGGDELFGGYRRYAKYAQLFTRYNTFPSLLARKISFVCTSIERALPRHTSMYERFRLMAGLLAHSGDFASTYHFLNTAWPNDELHNVTVHSSQESSVPFHDAFATLTDAVDLHTAMRAVDFTTYLPDNLLTKVDRATMAVGLEGREPFLDQNIVEFAASIPTALHRKNGEEKYLLKQLLAQHVPKTLTDRPKQGFSLPYADWLRHDLRSLLDEFVSVEEVSRVGVFNVAAVQKEREAFLRGGGVRRIWHILMFQMWYAHWMR